MIPRILCLILSATLALAAVELDSRISDNLKQIFGTPEHPLNSTEEVNVKKNIKDIFSPADKTGENRAGEEISLDPSTDDPKLTPCTRSDNQPGVCVVYYQCDPASKKLITDGDTLIDIRISACPHYLDVCCLPEAINTTEPVTTAAPPANPEEEKPEACGYSHLGDENPIRIMNDGTLAEYLEFPWMVAVLRRSKSGGADAAWSQKDYLGGGSLIHPRAVLTTAHKIEGVTADDLKIRAGEWDTQTRSEIYPEQEMNVQKIVRHENFYRPSVLNSVALLFLERPVTRMPNVGTACLGRRLPEPGTRCISMGWGKDKFFAQDSYATFLKKVELPLVSRSSCQTALRRTRLGSFFQLHNSLTCAGGEEGKDTCGGDGGSPLVCHIGDEKDLRYAIYGMVAYGIGCGDRGVPGVYVDTTEFYTWIEDKMKAEGLSGDTYTIDES
ncbi:phenoloxidase-activating factor 2 [Plutella xylostella]|uniref:phenoloxidase-activating factor 2 n=1 Tax=Plutella xylostella TaxID=51655 RepID=UPI0020322726|nr:phenoloxidase-activating factor 2 [Plutella xylostella]